MSMHLERPWLNSNGRSNNRKRPSGPQVKAQAEHEKWLKKRGLHPEQLAARKRTDSRPVKDTATPGYVYESRRPKTSDKVGNGFDTGIMAKLHLETPEVQEAILKKAQRIESLYSKGPAQYVTDGTDTTCLGARSRRA